MKRVITRVCVLKRNDKKFNLNSEIHQKNIFDEKNLQTDVIISRAFKPLPTILKIAKKIILKILSTSFCF